MDVDRRVADLEGLPRKNGELVFEAPWQSRAFGMVVALNTQGAYDWEEFRRRLVEEIARDPGSDYYKSWLGAFERLMLERRLLTQAELAYRTAEFLSQKRDEIF